MAYQQTQSYCSRCKQATLHARDVPTINHILHLLLTVFTAGFWLIIWLSLGLESLLRRRPPFRCQVCGTAQGTPSHEAIAGRSAQRAATAKTISGNLTACLAAVGHALAKVGAASGQIAARGWLRICLIGCNSAQKVDMWLKQGAGHGNDLVYRFLQFWAIAISAAFAFGILLALWTSSLLWLSAPLIIMLTGIAILIIGGKTIEQRRTNGGGIAAIGLVMLLIALPFTLLRVFGSASNQVQREVSRESNEQVGEQFSATRDPRATADANRQTTATPSHEAPRPATNRPKSFELVNTRGMLFRVYVPPESARDLAVFQEACREISAGRSFTSIEFWDDRSKIPSADEPMMTDDQLDAEVAMYVKNVVKGVNSFQWMLKGEGTEVGPID